MSRFAPVVPIHIAEQLSESSLGNYHLLLAHDVVKHKQRYKKVYDHSNMEIIMDNSVIELGGAVDLNVILDACITTHFKTVVLPDVLLDGAKTIESCSNAIETWKPKFTEVFGDNKSWGFMYVPQGKTIEEFAHSAYALYANHHINYWGIPRNFCDHVATRKIAIEICHSLNPFRRIHLLGFSENLVDDVISSKDHRVSGIDSTVPIRAASYSLPIGFHTKLPRRGDWWDTAEYNPLMEQNIKDFRRWISL